jgi:2-dehydropantoate 2-reductase
MARYIVYGTGAVGGSVGASLAAAGRDVMLVARGAQYEAIADRGLEFHTAEGVETYRIPVVDHPEKIEFTPDDVVLVAVKSQDCQTAYETLSAAAPSTTPVVCLQNAVENERVALRHFTTVLGALVIVPATFISPGVVVDAAAPMLGICDVGRYPSGTCDVAGQTVDDLNAARWSAELCDDIMRRKYAKLIENTTNAVQVVLGLEIRDSRLAQLAREEGIACLEAAGIAFSTSEEMRARRAGKLDPAAVPSTGRVGASTWQSLARGTGSVESDYLNGEVVLLGRTYGIPTPVNALLQELSNTAAREHREPGLMTEDEAFKTLAAAGYRFD